MLNLYVKPGCPWCIDAVDWLRERGYAFREIDVFADRAAYREMIRLSGQSLAPTLEVDGEVLPDFDVRQLELFLKRHNIHPE